MASVSESVRRLPALVPHSTLFALAAVLAVTVAPLAYAAAVSPSFRTAPVTAVLVLMISAQLGGTEIQLAFFRSLGVAIGGVVAIAVSLLVFPGRAHALGLHEAVRVLQHMAQVLGPSVRAGERVGLWMHNCVEWAALFIAVNMLGGVSVPISTRLTPEDYLEEPAHRGVLLGPGREPWRRFGMHQVDAHPWPGGGWIAAVDGR